MIHHLLVPVLVRALTSGIADSLGKCGDRVLDKLTIALRMVLFVGAQLVRQAK